MKACILATDNRKRKNKHYASIGMDIDFPKPKISLRQAARLNNFCEKCKEATGVDVHCEIYTLDGYNFYSNARNRKHFTFYARNEHKKPFDDMIINTNLMCVQGPYFALVYKLYNNMEPEPLDYHFTNGDVDCIFNDTFRIEKI